MGQSVDSTTAPVAPAEPNLTRPLPSLIYVLMRLEIGLHQFEPDGEVWALQRHIQSNGWTVTRLAVKEELMAFVFSKYMLPPADGRTYRIGRVGPDRWIWCARCNLLSWHPRDVGERYCSLCKVFHEG